MTFVLTRKGSQWLITAAQNTETNPPAWTKQGYQEAVGPKPATRETDATPREASRSLGPQRARGIDSQGPTRRHPRGDERGRPEKQRHTYDEERIGIHCTA